MEANIEKLYSELRIMKTEIMESLENNHGSKLILPMIYEELQDVEWALKKIENGTYGTCELSGELLPNELLSSVPLAKSMNDLAQLQSFYRKSFSHL